MGCVVVGFYCLGDGAHTVRFLQIWTDIEEDEQDGSHDGEAI
jgi:hypothetical protein